MWDKRMVEKECMDPKEVLTGTCYGRSSRGYITGGVFLGVWVEILMLSVIQLRGRVRIGSHPICEISQILSFLCDTWIYLWREVVLLG